MTLVTTEDRGAVRLISYANPPFGTMTGAGSSEMFDVVTAAGHDAAVRTRAPDRDGSCASRPATLMTQPSGARLPCRITRPPVS